MLWIDKTRDRAIANLGRYHLSLQKSYNKRVRPQSFNIGDLELRRVTQSLKPQNADKLAESWEGPYAVYDKADKGVIVLINRSPSQVPRIVLPDELFVNIAIKFGAEVNRFLAFLQNIASGGNLKQFLAVAEIESRMKNGTLFACFSVYSSCSDARVMWDQKTSRSRGFGFVSFRNQQDAQSAINDLAEDAQSAINDLTGLGEQPTGNC
ncbi:hypothetical protein GIB67_027537 [Kingdonia uniflora]|uniref:RRM domain-containing protein n=1 Tax=Kingdonia uniflora TaxID=39325 RepID=A0A7J7NKK1_9MAGN|nr:hypothetical protein GIB67_027537 [Kingdonia uniflora]